MNKSTHTLALVSGLFPYLGIQSKNSLTSKPNLLTEPMGDLLLRLWSENSKSLDLCLHLDIHCKMEAA